MIRMFMTQYGIIVCKYGEELIEGVPDAPIDVVDGRNGKFYLQRPLKLKPNPESGGAGFGPFFIKEEWILLNKDDLNVELEVNDHVAKEYERACAQIFSGITLL